MALAAFKVTQSSSGKSWQIEKVIPLQLPLVQWVSSAALPHRLCSTGACSMTMHRAAGLPAPGAKHATSVGS